jgi:hypothetical protein
MSEYASLESFISPNLEITYEDVKLVNGSVVKVKGLTRFEYNLAYKNVTKDSVDTLKVEQLLLRYGMVEPKITVEQAEKLQKETEFSYLQPIVQAIMRLSNITNDAEKSNV